MSTPRPIKGVKENVLSHTSTELDQYFFSVVAGFKSLGKQFDSFLNCYCKQFCYVASQKIIFKNMLELGKHFR